MFNDPIYWLILGVGMIFSVFAQFKVKRAYKKFSKVPASSGMSGAEAAAHMLRENGLPGVGIERVNGFLSDHYDPRKKVLRLSPDVHDGRSLASLGVACHEAGHALQDAKGYKPLFLRSSLVPAANIGSRLGIWFIFGGMALGAAAGSSWGHTIAMIGFYGFVAAALFTIVTLPVEFNASTRAKKQLAELGLLKSQEEQRGVATVLSAAALTYVAAAAAAILQALYWAHVLGLFGRR